MDPKKKISIAQKKIIKIKTRTEFNEQTLTTELILQSTADILYFTISMAIPTLKRTFGCGYIFQYFFLCNCFLCCS